MQRNSAVTFAWDDRPGMNVEHIGAHGLSTTDWETIFTRAPDHDHDRQDPERWVAEGRLRGGLFRIVYTVLDGTVIFPVLVLPITGFPIARRGLRPERSIAMTATTPAAKSAHRLPDRKAYARMVREAETRYAPDLPWEDLPLQRAGQRGRPKEGAPHLALTPRTVKLPDLIWKAFADAADREGVSVNAFLSAIGSDLLRRHRIEKEIRRLVKAGLLHCSRPDAATRVR